MFDCKKRACTVFICAAKIIAIKKKNGMELTDLLKVLYFNFKIFFYYIFKKNMLQSTMSRES